MLRPALRRSIFYTVLFVLSGCLDRFDPPLDLEDTPVLVVDGFLNGTDKSVFVNVSHAQTLSSADPPILEQGAKVQIYNEDNNHFDLPEITPGVYGKGNLNINPNGKFQLRITTTEGDTYHSDYVEIRQAPPITKLHIEPKDDLSGLEVRLSTEDPLQSTHYYRWDYVETWEYTATFRSDFKLVNRLPIPRLAGEGVYRCYRSQSSTRILIGTSVQLSSDVINEQLMNTIPTGDQRTSIRYSIQLIQRAIIRDEFEYLKQLQQSTENLGGLFDPLPSQTYGNMRNIDDSTVPVLGYFSAGTTQRMRAFYNHEDLPDPMKVLPLPGTCVQDTVCVSIPNEYGLKCHMELKTLKGTEVITGSITKEFETIGFYASTSECADCRTQGGLTSKPDFWP